MSKRPVRSERDVAELHRDILDVYRGVPTTTAGHEVKLSRRRDGDAVKVGWSCSCGKDNCPLGIGAAKVYAAGLEDGIAIGHSNAA